MRFVKSIFSLTVILNLAACADEGSMYGGDREKKTNAVEGENLERASQTDLGAVIVMQGRYSIVIRESGDRDPFILCKGDFTGTLYSNHAFVPDGTMNCFPNSEVDLKEKFPVKTVSSLKDFPEYGVLMRTDNALDNPNAAHFYPPKPSGFALIQDPTAMNNYQYEEDTQVSVVTEEGELIIDHGVYGIEMEAVQQRFETSAGDVFENVSKYSVTADGFENSPRNITGAEKKRTTWTNARPVALLKVRIETTVNDLQPGLASKAIDFFVGPMEIVIELQEVLEAAN